ncbi:aspartate/tyrosine/aromatic aminotransferase [Halobacteroides halobius DSM 5150]|uniref:Aminotransferase n=1 Tax=Halobacteroides halobius (strain ATCC 35273 / DSM 5150 / MD-1) TaxID=748449 RepID=L0K8K5_HALHC|nr:aminotransferase class I/II-fold pyridoxal phosphate-dependent enzyme [Halobacteroides halobius]AGB41331.1 aspartate/tyrosine/aromatic aminotransferase [Halobacteroides halobius DSM 5150]
MNWEEIISTKVQEVSPSGIRKFFDLVSGVDDVISLGVGEPDFVTPWHIRESAFYSLEQGATMYTSNYGLLELRKEIVNYLAQEHNLSYNPKEEVLVTVGVSEALDLALRTLLSKGDELLLPEPSYVSYEPAARLAEGDVVRVQTSREDEFKLTADNLKEAITPRSKLLVLCYPNNPTGATMDYDDLLEIAEVVKEHDLIVLADEIYSDLTYDGEHTSFASLPGMKERTIVFNGFSKAYAMTGWRIGYAVAPKPVIKSMMKIHQYTMLCAPIMGQKAALEALKNGNQEKKKMIKAYNQRRRVIVKGLNDIGLDCFKPHGSFYVFPSIQSTGLSSEEFSERLLQEEGVVVIPGNVFGESGEGFIRCSYAASLDNIYEALNRIDNFVKQI